MCHHCFLFLFAFFIALKNLKTTLSLQFDVNTDHRWDRGPGLYFDNPCYNLSPYGIILLIYEVGIVGLSRKRAGHMSDLYLWCLVQDLAYCRASIHFCWENEWMNEWIFFRGWWTWAWICVCLLAVVQSLSCVWLFETPWAATCQTSLSFTISWNLLRFTSFESVMLSNYLILCHSLLLLPWIFPRIRNFSNESAVCIR